MKTIRQTMILSLLVLVSLLMTVSGESGMIYFGSGISGPASGGGGGGGGFLMGARMTSNTSPAPYACDGFSSLGTEWTAFDGDTGTSFDAGLTQSYITFDFGSATAPQHLTLYNVFLYGIDGFEVEGSDDPAFTTFDTALSTAALNTGSPQVWTLSPTTPRRYWRVRWNASYDSMLETTKIAEIEFRRTE